MFKGYRADFRRFQAIGMIKKAAVTAHLELKLIDGKWVEGGDLCRLGYGVGIYVKAKELIANGLFDFLVAREGILRSAVRAVR
jgi:hypothetical protein